MEAADAITKLRWPLASELQLHDVKRTLHKPDRMLESLEDLIAAGRAWCPIEGATKRVEPDSKLDDWISEQASHMKRVQSAISSPPNVALKLTEFPISSPGKRTITTSRSIAYLLDHTEDFLHSMSVAFGAAVANHAKILLNRELPLFLYVSNSIESGGRAYGGDPFTGQVAAYSRIICYDIVNGKSRNFVTYYPHQLYSQFFTAAGEKPDNKGVKIIQANVDLIITAKGILLDPRSWNLV